MNLSTRVSIACCVFLLVACKKDVEAYSRSNIGILDEFSWACHDAQLREFMTPLLASGFKLIDCAINTDEFVKWENDEQTEFSEYYLVATFTEEYKKYPTKELFRSFTNQFNEQLKTIEGSNAKYLSDHMANASAKISDLTGNPLSIRNNSITPLGIYINDSNAFSYGTLVNTTYDDGGGNIELKQVSFISTVLSDKGILFKYHYQDFNKQSDIDNSKEKALNWVSINR